MVLSKKDLEDKNIETELEGIQDKEVFPAKIRTMAKDLALLSPKEEKKEKEKLIETKRKKEEEKKKLAEE
ncbi:MAG TPA: hypothetical protein PLQ72_03100, partial [Candidatus Pacearchaeota archaeon]|nr:hypothetical protein [Candidatus Pacearchaeota archaeon]